MNGGRTGPRTPTGKARSAQNARRHGLSVPVSADPDLSEQVADLAAAIAGPDPSPERLAAAMPIAEADVDLARIRRLRRALSEQGDRRAELTSANEPTEAWVAVSRLRRYERRAFSRRNSAIRRFDALDLIKPEDASPPPSLPRRRLAPR